MKFVKTEEGVYIRRWFRWYRLMDKYAVTIVYEPKATKDSGGESK